LVANAKPVSYAKFGESIVVSNGQANVGDTVVAIRGSTGIYKIVDILVDNSKSMVLEPKDKYTINPINSRSAYKDYAILARGE
jgi:hypothetical protein